mmetsp:Transcript_38941/g.44528  ORF Transcript_38941/g.44528 Transcript_38941/m.44528 type:complete len:83 (-) Transcript_38941:16-264(-)
MERNPRRRKRPNLMKSSSQNKSRRNSVKRGNSSKKELNKEEKKYEKYGKGFKMLKMMGFTADKHKEIVHVVKRDTGLGLGVK